MQICYHRVLASWTRHFFGYIAAILLVSTMLLGLLPATETSALTTTPTKMNFQGRLTDSSGTTMPDGLYNMKFRLFTVASGGTDVWNETRETTNRVQVTNGLFSVQLGAVTPISASLFASGSLYFEVELPTPATATCGTASCQTWTEGPMTTRSILSTSAYAFNSETLDGLDSTGFVQNQNGSAQTSTNFWIDGTARAATVQAATGLIAPGANSTSTFSVQNANTVAVFNIDTTNGEIEIGNYNGGTNPVNGKLVIGNSTNANLVSIVSGATSTSYTMTLPTAVGASGDCLKTSDASGTLTFGSCAAGGGVTTVGALDGGSANANGATITGSTIYLQSASASYGGLVNTTTQTFAGVKTFNDSITLAAAKTISMTGGTTASRPGSPTEGMIYYDTDVDQLVTYSNGKWKADSKTAAFIVAASDSSQADKDGAQYLANGEDSSGSGIGTLDGDQIEINNALTAASTKGGTVYLAPGTYTIDAAISIPNNVTLAGSGASTLIQLGNFGVTSVTLNAIQNTDATTGTGVVVRDLKLDGRRSINTNGGQTGIYLYNMGGGTGGTFRIGAKLTGIAIEDFRGYGVYVSYSNNNVISNNILQNNANGLLVAYGGSRSNTISSNTIQDSVGAGMYLTESDSSTITGNTIERNASGIILEANAFHYTITGNTIIGNTTRGVSLLLDSYGNTISNNVFTDNGGSTANEAIYADGSSDNSITGNIITDAAASGTNYAINIVNTSGTSSKNYLSDNRLSSTPATSTINDSGTGTVYANQSRAESGGQLTNRTANNATAFAVQNASGVNVLTADTSNGEVELGTAALAGKLVINDGANSTVTISANTITGDNNYTLSIPAMTASDTMCLQTLANCSGAATLGAAYTGDADGGDAIIALTTADGGILIRDAATPLTTAFAVQNNSGTAAYFSASSIGLVAQDASGNNALLFDSTTSELRVYENVASPTRYVKIYYDTAANAAVIAASSGTTQVGSGSGDVTIGVSDTTGTLLVLDTKTDSGDPTGANGGMYYNSNVGKFRCYQAGTWSNCIGLAKDAADTSSFAVTASNYLYGFTNSSTAIASGVLQLDNGTNTSNTLKVTTSGNPGSGSALIYASNTNASPTGNLIDLQSGSSPTSKFSVTAGGNVAFSGNVTAGAWNGTAVTGAYGGTGHSTTAVGDLLVGAAGNTWNKLTLGGNGTCLTSNGTTAAWGTCGGSLSSSYAADADGGDAIIALTTTDGGIRLQDAATPLATAFAVENNAGTAKYFSVSSVGVAMNDTNSRPTFLMDNSTHQLRVYEDVASSPRYAVMYYDTANNMAVFGASSGTTQIGTSGAGGDINLSLSGAATDKLVASKTFSLAGAYSGTDYSFTRGLTGTSYAMTGNVMKIEDGSSFTGGSSSPNVLYINQGNTGATGNLILAQTGGSTDKFKVDVSGNVTAAGDVSIAAGKSYTGAGAVTVSSASGSNLTLLAQGAAKVIIKPGTNSTSMFELQNASGSSMLLADSTNNQIKVGVSDTTGTLFVLDTKTDSGDPTGAAGGMYYNSNSGTFRCYEGSAWKDCTGDRYVYKTANQNHTATTKASITDLSWSVAASTNYRFRCVIFFAAGATANGWLVTATGPTTPTLFAGQTYGPSSNVLIGGSQWIADDGGTVTGSSGTTSANNGIIVEGILRNSTNAGTIQMRWANELATSTHVIQQGSYCSYNTF